MPRNASGSQNGVPGYYDNNGVFHPNPTTPSTNMLQMPNIPLTTMGVGTNAPSPNDIWVTQNGVDKNAVTGATRPATATKVIANVPSTIAPPPQNNNNSGGLTADILRSQFGFNDQNVINGILNDPSKRAQYERELSDRNNAPAPTKSYSELLTSNNLFTPQNSDVGLGSQTPPSISSQPSFSELWNKVRGTAGDFIDSMAYAIPGTSNRKDTGFSEWVAGRATPHTINAAENNGGTPDQQGIVQSPNLSTSKSVNLAQGSEVYPIASMGDGSIKYSDGTIKKGNSYTDMITRPTNLEYKEGDSEKLAKDILGSADKGSAWIAIDPNIDEQIKLQAESLYNTGASEQEVVDFIKKSQEDALNAEYDRLNSEADQLIPQYQKFADQAIGDVNAGLNEVIDLGTEKKDQANNTYAEKLLASQQNKRADETRLRNLFSNLGTAESSAFIENMAKNTSDYGKYEGDLNIANIKTVGDIDKEVVKAKANAAKQIDTITFDKDSKIRAVEENKRLYPQEKYVKKQQIMAQYKADMQGIYSKIASDTKELQNLKLQFMMNQSNINQNAGVQGDLLQKEYDLQQKTAQNINKLIPPELDQQLSNFSFRPQSSPQTKALWDSLKLKYPNQASLIDQVFMGTDYNTIKSQLTA